MSATFKCRGMPFGWLIFLALTLAGNVGAQAPDRMEYGPFLANSLLSSRSGPALVTKGILIKVGKEGDGAICFDTETLRCDRGWVVAESDGFFKARPKGWPALLELNGVSFMAKLHPEGPVLRGRTRFSSKCSAGWSVDGQFEDPRPSPYGAIPTSLGRYRGLYLHNDTAIVSYSVSGCDVLEAYGLERGDGHDTFTRTIEIGPIAQPLTLLVCDTGDRTGGVSVLGEATGTVQEGAAKGSAVALGGGTAEPIALAATGGVPEHALWQINKGRVALRLPVNQAACTFRIVVCSGGKIDPRPFATIVASLSDVPALKAMCAGAAPRWREEVVTKGALGTDDRAYTVDTLGIPETNPWHATLRLAGLDFLADGRIAICTLNGDVWIVSGVDQKLERLNWRRFATGLYQPAGLKVVADQIYVVGRDRITRLHDLNKDGEADYYENFNSDCLTTERQDEIALDLQTDQDGNFYYTKCGAGVTPDRLLAHTGCMIKTARDGSGIEVFATGLRSANGMCIAPDGRIYCTENDGTWSPASRINLVRRGDFFGQMETAHRDPLPKAFDPPLVWFPRSFDNSPGAPVWCTSTKWGPLEGHLLGTSYGMSMLYVILPEDIGTQSQGSAYKLPLKFKSGCMRGRFSPIDGQLYVCGMRGWITNAASEGALERVRYTGRPVTLPIAFHAAANGLFIRFNAPMDRASVTAADNWAIEKWNYKWANRYGSPEYSVDDPAKVGHDNVNVPGVELSADGLTVWIKTPDLQPVMQMKVQFRVKDAKGEDVQMQMVNTINEVGPERHL
jgi:hypothetical protein